MGIWPDGKDTDEIKVENNADEVDKFRCGSLLQDEDSIVDYYSKIKRCNDVIKLCKNHLKEVFIKGLTPKNKHFALMDFEYIFPPDLPLDVLVIMLIQVEKGTTSKLLLQACLDFISQQQRFAIYKSPIGKFRSPCEKQDIKRVGESKMTDKTEVPDTIITLNCLLSPSGVAQRSNLSEGSVTTLKISTNETVDQLTSRRTYPCYCKIATSQLGRGVVVYSTTHNIFSGLY
ncbi:unnamed protein product [Rhizophagus irregularis]|nr:unnamed protein product [Rhizophagus irregularis]